MNFSYIKFLRFINKAGAVSPKSLMNEFNINGADANKILNYLSENNYIYYTNSGYMCSYKGKHYISDWFLNWLGINFVAILALIVSVCAFIRTL